MTPQWTAKYRHMIPAVFISCFEIAADPNTDSLHDNQLKNEIATIRNALEASRYRCRYAVILIGGDSVPNGPELEERVINIRRAARLDEKCLFFLDAEEYELADFAAHVISALDPYALEFYRDLTRHTRRKRDKGSNPSHSISRLGWLARYEYKLGIFAEFRNEMDVAARHYTTSMMALFDSQGPVETTSSWSPRWTEARLWSDTTFIRLIRAQLASGIPTAAVKSWTRHRDRIQDLLDRKAKGNQNYGYFSWEARWSKVMAELTRPSTHLFDEPLDDQDKHESKRSPRPYAQPEKYLSQDQQSPPVLIPWQFLHHAGYWLRRSAQYTGKRLEQALKIPEEDRISPGESPASSVARRNEAYDTYMALEPHSEWNATQDGKGAQITELAGSLARAANDFQTRDQQRQADQIRLELCEQLIRAGEYSQAMNILKPLWKNTRWRVEEWRTLLERLSSALYRCSVQSNDPAMRIASLWELCNYSMAPRTNFRYDISADLKSISVDAAKDTVFQLDNTSLLSCLKLTFTFVKSPVYAGVPTPVQLVVTYDVHALCAPLTLQQISVNFDGTVPSFCITNVDTHCGDKAHTSNLLLQDVPLDESEECGQMQRRGQSDLRFQAGQKKAFNILLVPTEAGACQVARAIAVVKEDHASIEYSSWLSTDEGPHAMLFSGPVDRGLAVRARSIIPCTSIDVQPRPPRMDIEFVGLRNIYYTDEAIDLRLKLSNGEDDEADVELEIDVQSDSAHVPQVKWDTTASSAINSPKINVLVGKIPSGAVSSKQLSIQPSNVPIDMVLEVKVTYTVPDSSSRKIEKLVSADVVVIRPFEASHQVLPDYQPTKWPSYFHIQEEPPVTEPATDDSEEFSSNTKHSGIISKWQSRTKITSFATDTLVVETVYLEMSNLKNPAKLNINDAITSNEPIELVSNSQHMRTFTLDVQKHNMDEQRPVIATPILHLHWRRLDSVKHGSVHSRLELPRLSLASSEPRVLARQIPTSNARTIAIGYVIENPSVHLLTFNISIESSEEFAFSGPKSSTLHLTPLSRQEIKFLFMPFSEGAHIRPNVQVMDVYFNKFLGVIPTGSLRAENGELKACVVDFLG